MTGMDPGAGQGAGTPAQTAESQLPSDGGLSVRPEGDEAAAVRLAIDVVKARWALPVLSRLCVEPTQFNQLQRDLAVSSKVLTGALRALERDGLVARTPPDHPGSKGSYSLTPAGMDLQPALRALLAWARTHGNGVEQSRIRYDAGAAVRERGVQLAG